MNDRKVNSSKLPLMKGDRSGLNELSAAGYLALGIALPLMNVENNGRSLLQGWRPECLLAEFRALKRD
jgi:hypothetical protein